MESPAIANGIVRTYLVKHSRNTAEYNHYIVAYAMHDAKFECYNDKNSVELEEGTIIFIAPNTQFAFKKIICNNGYVRGISFNKEFFEQFTDSICKNCIVEFNQLGFATCTASQSSIYTIENRLHYESVNDFIPPDSDIKRTKLKENSFSSILTSLLIRLYVEYKFMTLESPDCGYPDNMLKMLAAPMVLKYGIDELLKMVRYSHSYLCKIFKLQYGKSINALLTETRMVYARYLLENSDLELQEIADMTGYDTISHFIQTYKTYHHSTPISYRRKFIKCRGAIKI